MLNGGATHTQGACHSWQEYTKDANTRLMIRLCAAKPRVTHEQSRRLRLEQAERRRCYSSTPTCRLRSRPGFTMPPCSQFLCKAILAASGRVLFAATSLPRKT